MSEWSEIKLKDITYKIGSGATPRGGSNSYKDSGIPLIRSQNVLDLSFTSNGLAYIDEEQASKLDNVAVETEDLLLNITGDSVARICKVPNEMVPARVNQHVAIIRINKKVSDPDFVLYHLQYSKPYLLSISEIGGTRRALTKGMIEDFDIPYPPLPEQKAIASVLSSLDDKIDLLHRQNKTIEAMAETLFRQWFVEEAEENWVYEELKNNVTVVDNRGKTPPNNEIETEYPLIEANALNGGNRLVNYSVIKKFVSKEIYYNWYRNKLTKNETLITTVGANIGAMAMFVIRKGNIAQNIIGVSANKISPFYLYQVLKYKRNEIIQMDIGGVQPSIKVPHLLSLIIPIPPVTLQKEFDDHLAVFVSKMETNYKNIQTLVKLRNTLLPKLMNGEVRVKYEDAMLYE